MLKQFSYLIVFYYFLFMLGIKDTESESKSVNDDEETPTEVVSSNYNNEERKLSCVSIGVADELSNVEIVEELEAVQEISPQITEVTISESSGESSAEVPSDEQAAADNNLLRPGALESVTEETEEELKADGSGRSPQVRRHAKSGVDSSSGLTQSLSDLPPMAPKRVGILKRSGAKKDRPLSDSFENLKMVENQGIVEMFHGQSPSAAQPAPAIAHGHSLDALLMNDRTDVNGQSPSNSHLSLTGERCDSQDSLTASDCESPKSRSRSDSEKVLSLSSSQRASSLSLNDAHRSRTSSTSSTEDLSRFGGGKKSGSIFSRFHGKKAKSLSALDTTENTIIPEDGMYIFSIYMIFFSFLFFFYCEFLVT